MTKVIVTFEKNWRGYAAGETAGFDSALAESLIESGYASEADKQSPKKGKPGAASTAPTVKKADSDIANEGASKPGDQTDADGKP